MLIDRIMARLGNNWAAELGEHVVFDVNNVANYYYNGTDQEEWHLVDDFPNVAPAFPKMWFEFAPSRMAWSDGRRVETGIGGLVKKLGVAMTFRTLEDVETRSGDKASEIWDSFRRDMDEVPKWLALGSFYLEGLNGMLTPYHAVAVWGVSESGRCVLDSGRLRCAGPQKFMEEFGEAVGREAGLFLHVPFLALSFMHCRNVKVVEAPATPRLDAARAKSGKPPMVRYKMLEIEPMKRVLREQGHRETDGLQQALHICRGHFKDYADSNGLFGKYHGMYWWDSQVRGTASRGVVVKDYSVVAA